MHELHNNVPFLPEKIKIEKVEKLVANLHDKKEYDIHIQYVYVYNNTYTYIHIQILKQALNHGLVLIKLHRIIKFK